MSSEPVEAMIGTAWRYEREGQADTSIAEFERVLKMDSNSMDGHYGMGMALRRAGKKEQAIVSFQKALELVESAREKRFGKSNTIDHGTIEDDRYMMLARMIKQRLSELQNS